MTIVQSSKTAATLLSSQRALPHFTLYSQSVISSPMPSSHAIETFPLQINATDRDTGDYGTVSYRLLSGASPLFSLDGTGVHSIAPYLANSAYHVFRKPSGCGGCGF